MNTNTANVCALIKRLNLIDILISGILQLFKRLLYMKISFSGRDYLQTSFEI